MQMIGGGDMGVWSQKQIIADANYSNALDCKNWFESVLPSGTVFAIIVKDDIDVTGYVNNTLATMMYGNGQTNGYERYRNGEYVNMTAGAITSAYECIVAQGSSYTIFYQ